MIFGVIAIIVINIVFVILFLKYSHLSYLKRSWGGWRYVKFCRDVQLSLELLP